MITGIYVRVSTEEQAKEGFSIRAQIEKLKSYAQIKDWQVYKVYCDEGISGKNIEARPALNEMLTDIKNGKVKNVLVFKVDRLTRSTKNLIELVELFTECNCAFNSLMEAIDTDSATGRMFLKIIGIFAEFERENLIERVKLGFERKVKEGYTLAAATTSFGYDRSSGEKIQKINYEEAVTVKRIFDMYLNENYSANKIAKTLNTEEIPTKSNRTWNTKTIMLILKNPNYIGKVRYSINDRERYFEADGLHDAIISEEDFYRVQEKINRLKKVIRTNRPKEDAYFVGILRCADCGTKLTTKRSYKTMKTGEVASYLVNYICIKAMKGICHAKYMSHNKMERAFEEYIANIEDLTEIENFDLTEDEVPDDFEEKSIISNLEKLNAKSKEISELFVFEKIDFESYKVMLDIHNEKKKALELKLNILIDMKSKPIAVNKSEIVRNIKTHWDYLDKKERLEFLQTFVGRIVVRKVDNGRYHDGDIIIEKIEFNEF